MPIHAFRSRRPRRAMVTALCAAVAGLVLAGSSLAGEPVERPDVEAADLPARVSLGPGGRDLRLAGDLVDGVSARVATLLAAHPEVERVHLTSDGGLVEEGLALGVLVAEHRLATYVPDHCASACTLAFVRGRERYLATDGRLGFHAPYEAEPSGRTLAVDAAPERAAYAAAGVAPDFTDQALAVSPDDIWIPDGARLLKAGVVTQIVGTDRFPDSALDDDASPQAARAQILNALPILAAVDAATLDRLAAWYRDGYATGRSESDAIEGLRTQTAAHLRRLFRRADDATMRDLGHAALVALQATGDADPETCSAISGGDLVVIDETLRSARHSVPNLTALITQARRSDGTVTEKETVVSAEAMPRRLARLDSVGCGPRIEAARRALGHPLPEAAAAVRRLLLDGARPEFAGVADP